MGNCRTRAAGAVCVFILVLMAGHLPAELGPAKDPFRLRARAIVEHVMQGIQQGDYDRFIQDFSSETRGSFSREDFLSIQSRFQERLGDFQSCDYLGFYRQSGNVVTLFKARFSKLADEDVLIKLVLDRQASEPKITGLWFDSPALR